MSKRPMIEKLTRDYSIELEFSINIGLPDLDIGRSVDLCGRHLDGRTRDVLSIAERKGKKVFDEFEESVSQMGCVCLKKVSPQLTIAMKNDIMWDEESNMGKRWCAECVVWEIEEKKQER